MKKTIFLAFLLSGCISSSNPFSDKKVDADTLMKKDQPDLKVITATFKTGVVSEAAKKKAPASAIEWVACIHPSEKKSVLVFHSESKAFENNDAFCNDPSNQVFLNLGYSVIGVNRPGFSKSTGQKDFGGDKSIVALEVGLKDALAKTGLAKPSGLWTYGAGSVSLFRYLLKNSTPWVIVGGGVYDMEQTDRTTSDTHLKGLIDGIKSKEGIPGIEKRSISYDPSEIKANVILYHGGKDLVVPSRQAQEFRDTLSASEKKSSLDFLTTEGHDLPKELHQVFLYYLVKNKTN